MYISFSLFIMIHIHRVSFRLIFKSLSYTCIPLIKTGGPSALTVSRDYTLTTYRKGSYWLISTANKNQQWHGEAALQSLNTITINALYMIEKKIIHIHYNDLHRHILG